MLVTWEKATDLHQVGDDGWSSRQASIFAADGWLTVIYRHELIGESESGKSWL